MNTRAKLLLAFLTLFFIILSVRPTRGQEVNSTEDLSFSFLSLNENILKDDAGLNLHIKIKKTTQDLLALHDKRASPEMITAKIIERKNLMLRAIKEHPHVFLENVLSEEINSRFDKKLASYFESPIVIEKGELQIFHTDYFEEQSSKEAYFIQTNVNPLERFSFYPAGELPYLLSGSILKIKGYRLDNNIAAKIQKQQATTYPSSAPSITPQAYHRFPFNIWKKAQAQENIDTKVEVIEEAQPEAVGGQKIALILIYPKGTDTATLPPKEKLFNDIFKGKVQAFFKEVSYGKMWLDEENSHVYGWYELDKNVYDDGEVDMNGLIQQLDADINFPLYDRLMIGGLGLYGGYAGIGKVTFNSQDGVFKASTGVFHPSKNHSLLDNFTHELSHGLGLGHAKSWYCNDNIRIGTDCQGDNYGNRFDIMGDGSLDSPRNTAHFNGYYKQLLKWLGSQDNQVINITKSGEYILRPLEEKNAVIAQLRNPDDPKQTTFYLEYRKPTGFDKGYPLENTQGILFNWLEAFLKVTETNLLDMSLDDGDHTVKVALLPQASFTDQPTGITVHNIGEDNDQKGLRFSVDFNKNCLEKSLAVTRIHIQKADDIGNRSPIESLWTQKIAWDKEKHDAEISILLEMSDPTAPPCPPLIVKQYVDISNQWRAKILYRQPFDTRSVERFYFSVLLKPAQNISAGIYPFTLQLRDFKTDTTVWERKNTIHVINPFLEGDLNQDNNVDIFDLVLVARDFGKKAADLPSDIDKDGDVDIFDLVLVARNFGKKL